MKLFILTISSFFAMVGTSAAQEQASQPQTQGTAMWTIISVCGTAMSAALAKLWNDAKVARKEMLKASAAERTRSQGLLDAQKSEYQALLTQEHAACSTEIARLQGEMSSLHKQLASEQRERREEALKLQGEQRDILREVLTTCTSSDATNQQLIDKVDRLIEAVGGT